MANGSTALPHDGAPFRQSLQPAAAEAIAIRTAALPRVAVWPLVFVIYATLLPREVSFTFSGNSFYADRLALLITLPWIFYNLWRGVIKFVLPDWLMVGLGAWIIFAFMETEGAGRGFVSGSGLALDEVAGYYLARVSFHSLQDVRRGLILCAPAFFLAALAMPIESISHHIFVRPAFASIFGQTHHVEGIDAVRTTLVEVEVRHGLARAYSVFDHPILAGLHLGTLLAIYWASGIRGWPRILAIAAALFGLFSISSSAFLAIALQIGLLGYNWLGTKVREASWPMFFSLVGLTFFALELLTKNGVVPVLLRFLVFDAQTGYFRVLIYQFGWQSVLAHPWFGIGLNPYRRPDWMVTASIDSHWLLLAVRYGLPAALLLFSACIVALLGLARAQAYANRRNQYFYRGIMISLATLVLMGFTVYLYGGTQTWLTILLGACVACSQHGYMWRVLLPEEERAVAPPGPAGVGAGVT